jgi:hypothetical protein
MDNNNIEKALNREKIYDTDPETGGKYTVLLPHEIKELNMLERGICAIDHFSDNYESLDKKKCLEKLEEFKKIIENSKNPGLALGNGQRELLLERIKTEEDYINQQNNKIK